jgi:drug/metabolite transporter (DMT)-like permease
MKRYNLLSMPRKNAIAYMEVVFAVLVWGGSFIATKIALSEISPIAVVWVRFAVGVIILGIAVALRHQFSFPNRRELAYFTLLGFLGITFHQWLQSTGLVTAQASTTAWIVSTTPIYMALFSWLFLHEKLNWLQMSGIALAAIGVLLVVSKGEIRGLIGMKFATSGDFLIMISAPNWAVFSILSRSGLKRHQATQMMFFVMAIGWLFTSILFLNGSGFGEIGHLTWNGWLGLGFLGVFCSGLAYIAWYDALQVVPASQVGAFLYIEPLVAVIVAWFILGEPLLVSSLIGGMIILIGIWLVQRSKESIS